MHRIAVGHGSATLTGPTWSAWSRPGTGLLVPQRLTEPGTHAGVEMTGVLLPEQLVAVLAAVRDGRGPDGVPGVAQPQQPVAQVGRHPAGTAPVDGQDGAAPGGVPGHVERREGRVRGGLTAAQATGPDPGGTLQRQVPEVLGDPLRDVGGLGARGR